MTAQEIWTSFCDKLKNDTLRAENCTEELGPMLLDWLSGPQTLPRRTKFLSGTAQFYDTAAKAVVMLDCAGDPFRFDFLKSDTAYKLAFMECVTLPVHDITMLPYSSFAPYPEMENHIRREKDISKTVYYYLKFKELLGREAAVRVFLDGAGESTGARSWVPFYSDGLAFIVYTAWMENRINGEAAVLEEFSEDRSVIRFKDHSWLRMYRVTGHLKAQIPYDEYIGLFEAVWRDRAEKSGWMLRFSYEGEDTVMTFEIISA